MCTWPGRIVALLGATVSSAWVVVAAAAVPQLVATEGNAMALDAAGSVYSWGSDRYGQTGQGRVLFDGTPRRLGSRGDVVKVSAGGSHSLMLTRGGDVLGWGANDLGQLGDPSGRDSDEPRLVFTGAEQVAAAEFHSTVVDRSGAVWESGGWSSPRVFTRVAGVPRPVQILHKHYNTFVLAADGGVWSWGDGQNGILGFGAESGSPATFTPRRVTGLPAIARLYASDHTIMALDGDGQVWAWGAAYGIDGTPWDRFVWYRPTKLPIAGRVAAISGRVVVFADGTLAQWSPAPVITPIPVATPERFTDLSPHGGRSGSADVDVLLSRSGRLWTFGFENSQGQLGRPPGAVLGPVGLEAVLTSLAAVSTNARTVFVVTMSGQAWVWGSNRNRQLLLPITDDRLANPVPTRVQGLPAATEIDSRGVFGGTSLVVGGDGSLWGWGANDTQQLGVGDSSPRSSPTRIALPVRVRSARTGSLDSIALDVNGNLWSWGYFWSTIRRDGDYARPAQATNGADLVAIAKGLYFALALKRDGSVLSWGATYEGQTGDGSFTPDDLNNRVGPVAVSGLRDIVAISAGQGHALALDASGRVYGWGANDQQQLGFRSPPNHTVSGRTAEAIPVRVPTRRPVVAINAGLFSSTLLYDDGSVQVFGDLAASSAVYTGLGRPVQLIARNYNAGAVYVADVDGMAYSAPATAGASNYFGELGNGTFATEPVFRYMTDSGGAGYLNLFGRAPVLDPAAAYAMFVAASRASSSLTTTLTDPRAAGLSGDIYFTALVPATSPLLTGCEAGCAAPDGAAPRPARRAQAAAGAGRPRKGPLNVVAAAGGAGAAMVAGVLTRGGFKQTGGQGYAQADSAFSGALAGSGALAVYANLSRDPLADSALLVCIGVTVPELSAKGQVVMRPIATGTAVPGVVQCPPVQTAATMAQFRSEASGPVTARTITAVIDPLAEDRGRSLQVFSWAVAPDGRQFMQTGPNQWEAMTEPMRPAATITVPATGSYRLEVTRDLDLSALQGTLVFVGLGRTWEEVRSLNKAGHHHTVR